MSHFVNWIGLSLFFLAWCAAPLAADDSAAIGTVNEHHFLSAPTSFANYRRLYYETCNLSKAESGFHWKAAGFGVGAPNELRPTFCARKEVFGFDHSKRVLSGIDFQGGAKGNVDTWVPCRKLPFVGTDDCDENHLVARGYRLFTTFSVFTGSADQSNIRLETLSIRLSVQEGSTAAELVIEGSAGFEHLRLALPDSKVSVDEIRALFEPNGRIEFLTFSAYAEDLKLDASTLAADIPSESPVLLLERSEGSSGSASVLRVSDISKLGKQLIALVEQENALALRNDISIPNPE